MLSAWLYEHSSNAAGDELLAILKDSRFIPSELRRTASACKKGIKRLMYASQPLFRIRRHRLQFRECETRPPRRRWATAEVVSRGLLSCLITGLTNPRVYDWDKVFHYPNPAPPAGTAEEPYHAAACREGCADAIARGLAMGWKQHLIVPYPFAVSEDGQSPDQVGNSQLGPVAVWPLSLPFELRRSILAGEHVMLAPDLQLGKTKTASLTRDHRRANQEGFQFFVNEANELYRRGFLLHGSHVQGCPYTSDVLLIMPFCVGGCFDAVGAWIRLNARYFHCFLCRAGYDESWLRPSAAELLPLEDSVEAMRLRRRVNDSTRTAAVRRDAVKTLKAMNLNPETTAWDSLAVVHMRGRRGGYVDGFHCGELGPNTLVIFGIKQLCDNVIAVAGRGHSVSKAAALLDDFISWYSRHNSGYHRLPAVRDFTAVRQFTGMMVRSLLFSLLAALCSMKDLTSDRLLW